MSIKHFSISKYKIKNLEDIRFSPSYHYVDFVFSQLSSHYNVSTLRELGATISSGSYIDTYIDEDKGIPYIRVGNVKPFDIDEYVGNLKFVSKNVPEKIKLYENDVIVSRTQATPDKLGVASIASMEHAGNVISQHVSKISIDKVSPYYLVAYLNSNFYKAQTALATHGDTRVEMTHLQMYNVKVFSPEKVVCEDVENKTKLIGEYNLKSLHLIRQARKILKDKIKDAITNEFPMSYSVNKSSFIGADLWTPKYSFPQYVKTNANIKRLFNTTCLGEIISLIKGDEVGSDNYLDYLIKSSDSVPFIRTSDIVNYETDIYPDYYIPYEVYVDLDQDIKAGDILFSKDAKIGQVGVVTTFDKAIYGSGFCALRLNKNGVNIGLTPEYLFTVLSIKEIGIYESKRRTVVASTIPHLREDRVKEIEIPILDKETIDEITELVREAFKLKAERKRLIAEVRKTIDDYFNI